MIHDIFHEHFRHEVDDFIVDIFAEIPLLHSTLHEPHGTISRLFVSLVDIIHHLGIFVQFGVELRIGPAILLDVQSHEADENIHDGTFRREPTLQHLFKMFIMVAHAFVEQILFVAIDFVERPLGNRQSVGNIIHFHRLDSIFLETFYSRRQDFLPEFPSVSISEFNFLCCHNNKE